MKAPIASLIVLAWPPNQKRERNVTTLLESLGQIENLEVIALINGDDSELSERLKDHTAIDRVIGSHTNIGVSAGWNKAAAEATADYLMFANEDVTFGEGAIGSIIKAMQDGARFVGVGCSVWSLEDLREVSRGTVPARLKEDEVVVPEGFLLGMERSLWKEVGGFDEDLSPAFFEEVDFAAKAARAGVTLQVIPVEVDHPWGVSAADPSTLIAWDGHKESVRDIHRRNHRRMLEKWSPDRWRSAPLVHQVMYACQPWVGRIKRRMSP